MVKKYKTPDIAAPLEEPTLNRRLWAAYLRAGFDRASFARAMGVGYNLVQNWDGGKNVITLVHLMRASEIVGYTLDELVYGSDGGAVHKARETRSLDERGVMAVLDDMHATSEQLRALADMRVSAAGVRQRLTPIFVRTFLQVFAATFESKEVAKVLQAEAARRTYAIDEALRQAERARDQADAIARGRKPYTPPAPHRRKTRKKVARVATAAPEHLD